MPAGFSSGACIILPSAALTKRSASTRISSSCCLRANRRRDVVPLPAVFSLNGPCGPSAVRGLVIPVVVDAVQCQPFWPTAHVSEKMLKRIAPPIANSNSSSAIVAIVLVCAVVAASIHGSPSDVFGRDAADAGSAMRGVRQSSLPNAFLVEAPATLSRGAQRIGVNNRPIAAIAQAHPEHPRPCMGGASLDKQASKPLPCEFKRSHINYSTRLET